MVNFGKFTPEGFSHLSNLRNLQSLTMEKYEKLNIDEVLNYLAKGSVSESLEYLSIQHSPYPFKNIGKFKNLKTLKFGGKIYFDESLEKFDESCLENLPRHLKHLSLGFSQGIWDSVVQCDFVKLNITDFGIKIITTRCKELEELLLSVKNVSTKSISMIGKSGCKFRVLALGLHENEKLTSLKSLMIKAMSENLYNVNKLILPEGYTNKKLIDKMKKRDVELVIFEDGTAEKKELLKNAILHPIQTLKRRYGAPFFS